MSLLQNQAIGDLEEEIESKTWLLGVGSDKGRTLADLLLTFLLEKTKNGPLSWRVSDQPGFHVKYIATEVPVGQHNLLHVTVHAKEGSQRIQALHVTDLVVKQREFLFLFDRKQDEVLREKTDNLLDFVFAQKK
jgi:hypothetical protein